MHCYGLGFFFYGLLQNHLKIHHPANVNKQLSILLHPTVFSLTISRSTPAFHSTAGTEINLSDIYNQYKQINYIIAASMFED